MTYFFKVGNQVRDRIIFELLLMISEGDVSLKKAKAFFILIVAAAISPFM